MDTIRKIVNLDIAVEGVAYRPITIQHRDNVPRERERFYQDLDEVFGWLSANPNDEEKIRRFEQLYLLPEESIAGATSTRSLPRRSAVEALLDSLISGDWKAINIVGKRGAGKTAATNYVLTVKHTTLQQHHTTWLRADVAKLHAINEERLKSLANPPMDPLTVNEYMILHAFMVVIFYGAKDSVLSPAFGLEKQYVAGMPSEFETLLSGHDPSLAEKWRLIRAIEQERARQVEARTLAKDKDKDLKWFFAQLERKITEDECHQLFKHFWDHVCDKYRKSNNGATPRLVLVFDGVDNIRSDEHAPEGEWLAGRSARTWYLIYLAQLRQYMTGGGKCLRSDKCMFVIREETEIDFTGDALRAHQQQAMVEPERFDVEVPDFDKLFRKKLAFAKNSQSHCESGDSLHKNERLAIFEWFKDEFVQLHAEELRRTLTRSYRSPTVPDVVAIPFNGNVRSFSRNLIRSFAYLYDYGVNHSNFENATSPQARLDFLKAATRLIFEGSILGGNSYMRTNADIRARGRWCPNFFEFEASTNSRWDGLVLFRVLQAVPTMDSHKPALVLSDLLDALALLGYHRHVSRVAVYSALEYGLLRLGSQLFNQDSGKHEFALHKTRKGKYLADLLFASATNIYVVATGAVFSGVPDYSEPHSKLVNNFIHRQGVPRYFGASVLRTVVHLLRHLKSSHKRDMNEFSQNAQQLATPDARLWAETLRARFIEPNDAAIVEQLTDLLQGGIAHAGEQQEVHRLRAYWLEQLARHEAGTAA